MSVSNDRIAYLFSRYFEKSASDEESAELFQLLNLSADDEHLNQLLRQAWDIFHAEHPFFEPAKSDRILNSILNAPSEEDYIEETPIRVMPVWRRYAAAAAIITALIGGYFALKPAKNTDLIVKVKTHDVAPGGNKAILTLANGKSIVLDSAQNGVIAKQSGIVINKTQNGQLVYTPENAIAAADAAEINTVATPRGGQYQIVLPDGTKVWLNAASSIKYPTVFTGKDRQVEMTGEVYFEVAKNPARPFIVKAEQTQVEVLGTHFNIMAYTDEDNLRATLLEGSIRITAGGTTKIITPGEQAVVNSKNELSILQAVDLEEVIAWKNGLLQFNDAGIKSIMREAARWYDVSIVYEGKAPEKLYNGRISRNVKASELMKMLQYTGVNSRIEGKTIYIIN